ncbi:MAG: hypothetical protein ACOC8X_06340 [Chloroflexota bacterium]
MTMTEGAVHRHLRLNPLFARHLAENGQHLLGDTLSLTGAADIHPAEQVAFLAHRALRASAALAPARLPEQASRQASRQLRELATVLSGGEHFDELTTADLFAVVQERLQEHIQSLSLASVPAGENTGAPHSNLEAIYEDGERLLAIIPPLAGRLLRRVDWNAFLQNAPEHLMTLSVGTAGQVRLAIRSERPLDYLLGSFRRLWGRNPLAGLQVSGWAVFRQAARKPSGLLYRLSTDYVHARDGDAVRRVIHDYQNLLLNMRLEHELLHRTQGTERSGPDQELPRRNEPNDVRIDAIIDHLEWWAAFYAEKMAATPATERMAPQ